jgi:hypothetical protein
VNANGDVLWSTAAGGVAICNLAGAQQDPRITSDGNGGAIITWQSDQTGNGNWDIYAQCVDRDGEICEAIGIEEVPNFSEIGLIILVLSLGVVGVVLIRRSIRARAA